MFGKVCLDWKKWLSVMFGKARSGEDGAGQSASEVIRFGREGIELSGARSGNKCCSTTELGTARSGKSTFGSLVFRRVMFGRKYGLV